LFVCLFVRVCDCGVWKSRMEDRAFANETNMDSVCVSGGFFPLAIVVLLQSIQIVALLFLLLQLEAAVM